MKLGVPATDWKLTVLLIALILVSIFFVRELYLNVYNTWMMVSSFFV